MIFYDVIRITILLLVTFAYALFDVFNKREIPNVFVYLTVLLGAMMLLTYSGVVFATGVVSAVAVGFFGYLLYRVGWIGAGDVLEFVFVSLAMPVQALPLLANVQQFGMPFIFSVLMGAGYVVSIYVPLYYLLLAKKGKADKKVLPVERINYIRGFAVLALYVCLMVVVGYFIRFDLLVMLLILLVAIPSALILIYEKTIYSRMVSFVYPDELTEGDMIAVSLMNVDVVSYYSEKFKDFGMLATRKLINEMRHEKKKVAVYRNSVPFALFVFMGVVISLLFGNIMLLILL